MIFLIINTLLYSKINLPKSFSGEFKQTVTTDKSKKIIYIGDIIFSSPSNFKWSYINPTQKEVCSDGRELLVVDHDLEQVSAYIIDNGLDLTKILEEAKPHHKMVYLAKYRGKSYTIGLNRRGELHSIAYRDDLDNIVSIIFSSMKYSNSLIKSTKLKCNYPADYDYITQ